jgi:hypothetical protein
MMTFREFLQQKAAEQQQQGRRERRDEWVAAVDRLIEQLRTWLAESDPDRLLDVVRQEVEKAEPGLGVYQRSLPRHEPHPGRAGAVLLVHSRAGFQTPGKNAPTGA